MESPRENLTRTADFEVVRAEDEGDGLTLEGYAAVFNQDTVIDSWEGHFTERIAPGAFKRTLDHQTPVLQFDHGQHPLLGSIPLGSIRHIREDTKGLFVRARLSNNWLIQPVRDAIADRAISGMSFRFSVPKGGDTWDETTQPPTRTITEIMLAELGPVVFPAYTGTEVGVRARQIAEALTDPEIRADLARIFAQGTPLEPASGTSSSDSPNEEDSPQGTPPRVPRTQRRQRALEIRGVSDEDRGDEVAA